MVIKKPSFLKSSQLLFRSRLFEIFIWPWGTAVACLIVGKGFPPILPTAKSIITIALIALSVYIYNDTIDFEVDRLNPVKKQRPLASNKVPIKHANILVVISAILGLAISYSINLSCFSFSLLYFLLFFLYSYPKIHLKKRFIIKELIINSAVFLTAFVGNFAVSNTFCPNVLFSTSIIFLLGFSMQPALLDSTDIEADKIQGVKTIAMVLDWRRKMQLLFLGVLVIMTLTPLTYIQFDFNMILPIYVVIGGLIFLRYLYPISNHFEATAAVQAKKIGSVYFILLQVFSIISII